MSVALVRRLVATCLTMLVVSSACDSPTQSTDPPATCRFGLCSPVGFCTALSTDVSVTVGVARVSPPSRSSIMLLESKTTAMRECTHSPAATDMELPQDTCTVNLNDTGTVTLQARAANGERFVAWHADPEIGQCPTKCLAATGDGECTLSQKDVTGLDLSVPLYCAAEFGPGGPVACSFRGPQEEGPIWVNLPEEVRVTISGYGGSTPQCAALNGVHTARLTADDSHKPNCSWQTSVDRGLPYDRLVVSPVAYTPERRPLRTEFALMVRLWSSDRSLEGLAIGWPNQTDRLPPSFLVRGGERFDFGQFRGYSLTADGVSQAEHDRFWNADRPCFFVLETSQVQLDF